MFTNESQFLIPHMPTHTQSNDERMYGTTSVVNNIFSSMHLCSSAIVSLPVSQKKKQARRGKKQLLLACNWYVYKAKLE